MVRPLHFAPPRQILVRIGWLLIAQLVLFVLALGAVRFVTNRSIQDLVDGETMVHGYLLDRALQTSGSRLQMFVESYARRSPITRSGEQPNPVVAKNTIAAGLRTFDLDDAWVIEPDGTTRFYTAARPTPTVKPAPLSPAQLQANARNTLRYYTEYDGVLFEVQGRRLAASEAIPDAERGWLFAAVRWDEEELAKFNRGVEGSLSLVNPGAREARPRPNTVIRIERPLRNLDGKLLRTLRLEYQAVAIDTIRQDNQLKLLVVGMLGLLSLGVLSLCLWRWILQPTNLMRRSLVSREVRHLAPLHRAGGDFGELAQHVEDYIEQQLELERSLAERGRLARELHDGTIQVLFATGMKIGAVREIFQEKPEVAGQVLEDIRQQLNRTIHDLRRFIDGLEGEQSAQHGFGEAARAVIAEMQSIRPLECLVEIDDDLANQLTVAHHLLQILREALSNSMRHSDATRFQISLRSDPLGVKFELSDNGTNFQPGVTSDRGRGLANFEARAREIGASLQIAVAPGGGAQITLLLPPPK